MPAWSDIKTGTGRRPLREAFEHFDVDKAGKLSKEEFKAILTRPGAGALEQSYLIFDEAAADQLMADFDKNGDGEIDIEEFIAACAIIDGDTLYEEAAESLALSEGIEERNAAFMKADAEIGKLLDMGTLYAETAEEQNMKIGVAIEAAGKKRAEWYAKILAVREYLYAAKALVKETHETLMPKAPESSDIYTCGPNGLVVNVAVKEQWDKFSGEMEATAAPFKEALTQMDVLKSPEYKAKCAERDACYEELQKLNAEVSALIDGLPDGAELMAALAAL